MTWQDELQHLDAELAAGRISAEDYRQRRDAVMTRAHAEQAGTPSGGFPQQAPGQHAPGQAGPAQPGQSPFPPAFNWGGPAGQGFGPQGAQQPGGDSDSTQVVNLNEVTGQPQPGQTQPGQPSPPQGMPQQGQPSLPQGQPSLPQGQPSLPQGQPSLPQGQPSPPQGMPQQNQPPYGWPNQQPPASAPPGRPQMGQPQMGQPQPWPEQAGWGPQQGWGTAESSGTPWGDSGAPEHGDTSWMRQGPEVFESAGSSSKGKVLGLSVGGALVAALLVVGIFYFTSSGGGQTQAQGGGAEQQAPAPPPTPTTPPLPEPPPAKPAPADPAQVLVPPPAGPAHPFNGALSRPALEGAKSGVLTDQVRRFALSNGMVEGWFHGTDGTKAPLATTLIALKMPDEAAASRLAQAYLDSQEGLAEVDDLSYQGVQVLSTGSTFRTAYTSHSWAIIVDVRAVKGPGKDARALFDDILSRQLAKTPPTVRE